MGHKKAKKQRQPKVSYEEMMERSKKMWWEYHKGVWTGEGWYDED